MASLGGQQHADQSLQYLCAPSGAIYCLACVVPVCLPLFLAKIPRWPPITCPCGSIATVAVCRFKGVGKKTVACVLMFCLGSHEVCSLPLCIRVAQVLALVAL